MHHSTCTHTYIHSTLHTQIKHRIFNLKIIKFENISLQSVLWRKIYEINSMIITVRNDYHCEKYRICIREFYIRQRKKPSVNTSGKNTSMCLIDFCKLPKWHTAVWPEAQAWQQAPYIKADGIKHSGGKWKVSLMIKSSYQFQHFRITKAFINFKIIHFNLCSYLP